MSDLIVVTFPDDATAFAMRAELVALQTEYLLQMEDIVVVSRGLDSQIQLHQAANLSAIGAVSGGFWGAFLGLLFLNPLLGAAMGAGAGALSGAVSDIGIDDNFMRQLATQLKPGGAAVFLLVRKFSAEKVAARLTAFHAKGQLLQTSLTGPDEAALRAAFPAPKAA